MEKNVWLNMRVGIPPGLVSGWWWIHGVIMPARADSKEYRCNPKRQQTPRYKFHAANWSNGRTQRRRANERQMQTGAAIRRPLE